MVQATMAAIPGLKETYVQLKTRMEKAVEDFRKEMTATRTGRASVHMLDGATQRVFSDAVTLTETRVTPVLERHHNG